VTTSPVTAATASGTDNHENRAAAPISAATAARIGNVVRSRRFSTASLSTVMRPSSSLLRSSATRSRGSRSARANRLVRSEATKSRVALWVEIRSP
jgi:hypothetical protein